MVERVGGEIAEPGAASPQLGDRPRIDHKRVHWRALVLPDRGAKIPGHVVDVAYGNMRLVSRYSFAVGSRLNLAVFVPDVLNEGKCVVTQVAGEVTYQVMHGDEVQTGLSVNVADLPDATVKTISAAIDANI